MSSLNLILLDLWIRFYANNQACIFLFKYYIQRSDLGK